MNATPVHVWWHCASEVDKQAAIDTLCQQGRARQKTVAVLAAPEQVISNLSVRENIELQCAWECREKPLAPAVLECLQRGFRAGTSIEDILSRQAARLSTGERRWLGIARALHGEASWLVVEDEEKNLHALDDERLQALSRYFPASTLYWVSLHKPATLPTSWVYGDTAESAPGEIA